MTKLTPERLRELLDYKSETGEFRWKITRSTGEVGAVAGCLRKNSYRLIGIDQRVYLAHRLAWLYVTGQWPVADIDHIDGQRDNNAFHNLREATRTQNNANSRLPVTNKSGLKGASWDRWTQKWVARIQVAGKGLNLGRFDTAEAAHAAYVAAAEKYFGTFARSE